MYTEQEELNMQLDSIENSLDDLNRDVDDLDYKVEGAINTLNADIVVEQKYTDKRFRMASKDISNILTTLGKILTKIKSVLGVDETDPFKNLDFDINPE
ncbi:hypothetical protein QTO02_10080 [Vibrio fortis]